MLKLKLLGAPGLIESVNTIVPLKNRKDLALLAYLSRTGGAKAPRETLAALLWSGGTAADARMSLRQTLKNLRKAETASGVRFLATTRTSVGFASPAPGSDIEDVVAALSKPRLHGLKRARALLPPQWSAVDKPDPHAGFLSGYDALDPAFEAWRLSEARAVRLLFRDLATDRLARLPDVDDACLAELARFLLGLDPADEWAHHMLIRHFSATNRPELATRYYDACVKALAETHGRAPCPQTEELLHTPERARAGRPPPHRSAFALMLDRGLSAESPGLRESPSGLAREAQFPVIHLLSHPGGTPDGTSLAAEFVEEVGRNRDLVVRPPPAPERRTGRLAIDDARGGQFVLEAQATAGSGSMMVELRSRGDAKPVFADIVTVGPSACAGDRKFLIGRSVRAMERRIVDHYRKDPVLADSTYRKLAAVYELTASFDKRSCEAAEAILDEIETGHGPTSLTYAYRSSIFLFRNLQIQAGAPQQTLLKTAEEFAGKAVAMDQWRTVNHRYRGFAAVFVGKHCEGIAHMLAAQALSPHDPHQCIATAETCAFADDIEKALQFQDAARKAESSIPRYYYGYMANIAFAAGDFEAAATFAGQAPVESMDYRAVRIAALHQLDRHRDARREMQAGLTRLQNRNAREERQGADDVVAWMCAINPFANPRTLDLFQRGIQAAARG